MQRATITWAAIGLGTAAWLIFGCGGGMNPYDPEGLTDPHRESKHNVEDADRYASTAEGTAKRCHDATVQNLAAAARQHADAADQYHQRAQQLHDQIESMLATP